MKRMLLAALSATVALPAFAAPPAPAAVSGDYDWTGAYVGANIAEAWGSNSFDAYNATTGVLTRSGSDSTATFHGGIQAGYNYMFASRLVIGALCVGGSGRQRNNDVIERCGQQRLVH